MDTLLAQGPIGAAFVLLCLVVIWLYRDGINLREKLSDLAERRTADVAALAKETATGLATSSATTAALAEEVSTVSRLLQTSLDLLRLLPVANETIIKQLEANAGRIDRIADKLYGGGTR